MKRWVVGFLFDENMKNVILLQKNRPSWQKGLLNGVGGHIKEIETPIFAMIREFEEETGVHFRSWRPVAVFEGLDGAEEDCVCYFFYGVGCNTFDSVKTVTDEKVLKIPVAELSTVNLVKNLYWLIPMCLDTGLYKPVWFGGMFPK